MPRMHVGMHRLPSGRFCAVQHAICPTHVEHPKSSHNFTQEAFLSGERLRRSVLASASSVDMAPCQAVPTPGDIDVHFKGQHNGRLTVQGTMHIDAPADLIYDMISDYEKAPDIFENISTSTSHMEGDAVEVRQQCNWRFLIFNGTFELVLGVTENVPERELIFRLKKSKFMRDFEGRWQVRPLPDDACLVTHTLSVTPQPPPPDAIADITSKIFMRQVRGILRDLQNGVENYRAQNHAE